MSVTIQLQYNPYTQEANFKHKVGEGKYEEMEVQHLKKKQSEALEALKQDMILQNQIGNLVKVLCDIYGQKLSIEFAGTDADFEDLKTELMQTHPNISVEKIATPYLREAEGVKYQIGKIRTQVLTEICKIKNYENEQGCTTKYADTLRFDTAGIDAALSDRTPVVFLGKGSNGKSSVINALIGAEVLPSATGATTELVYEIRPSKDYKISINQGEQSFDLSKPKLKLKKRRSGFWGKNCRWTLTTPILGLIASFRRLTTNTPATKFRLKCHLRT